MINGGNHTAQANSAEGSTFARGIRAFLNATVNNANTSAIAMSAGTGVADAIGIFALSGNAMINGGTHTGQASSAEGRASARGIRVLAIQNATVENANTSGIAESTGAQEALAFGVEARIGNAVVSGGTHTGEASSAGGLARARGIFAGQNAQVENARTSAVAVSTGEADLQAGAIGVLAFNNATVTGGRHDAQAQATSSLGVGVANATGIRADNQVTVDGTEITAEANGFPGATSTTGVQGGVSGDDSVTNSTITLSGNGTNTKCADVENSDGSCS